MPNFEEMIEEHTAVVRLAAKRSILLEVLSEAVSNNYETAAEFRGALYNKLEELNDEQD